MNDEMASRLRRLRFEMTPQVGARHLAAIREALQQPLPPARRRRPRRRLVLAGAALLLVALPGVGFAAESALPGDFLYPVKQATEWARSLVDDTVRADHRVEELEGLLDRGAPPETLNDHLQRAVDAVRDLPPSSDVHDRLHAVRDRLEHDADAPHDAPADRTSGIEPTTTTTSPTATATTIVHDSVPSDRSDIPPPTHPPSDRPADTTSTTTHGDSRDQPPGDRRREG